MYLICFERSSVMLLTYYTCFTYFCLSSAPVNFIYIDDFFVRCTVKKRGMETSLARSLSRLMFSLFSTSSSFAPVDCSTDYPLPASSQALAASCSGTCEFSLPHRLFEGMSLEVYHHPDRRESQAPYTRGKPADFNFLRVS